MSYYPFVSLVEFSTGFCHAYPDAGSKAPIGGECLIHNVPRITHVLPVSDQSLDVVLHNCGQSIGGPGAIDDPFAELRNPHKVVTSQIFAMIFGNVDIHLPACEVEDTLFRLGGKELHVVGWGDLAKDVGVVQDRLVQYVLVLSRALRP